MSRYSSIRKPETNRKFLARFVKYIETSDGCWLWKGATSSDGYGCLNVKRKTVGTHRIAYELFRGEIPNGQSVLHKCDNPPCVNPAHLFLGTDADNAADRVKKGRQTRGEFHGKSKLFPLDIITIRGMKESGQSLRRIAKYFNVSFTTIRYIVNRKKWKHVP